MEDVMALRITKDGIISVLGLKSYIGKGVDPSIEQITKDWSFKKVCDCIGLSGYRNITMMKMERQIEIICETENREEIINKMTMIMEAESLTKEFIKKTFDEIRELVDMVLEYK